jgi:hypothetical protein
VKAQIPAGTEFQVNSYTTGQQLAASLAADAEGDFVVVWASYRFAVPSSVQAQRFASDGSLRGPQFQVNADTTFHQDGQSVASDSDGNFVVVWHGFGSVGTDSSGTSVKGRRFASDGSALGAQFQVNTQTMGSQYTPSVAMDSDGDFVVVWVDDPPPTFGIQSIKAQRFGSDGSARGSEFQVDSLQVGGSNPSVAVDSDGDFVAVWTSLAELGSDLNIEGQRFASDGSMQGGQFRVNAYTTYKQFAPSVAADSDGDFVVVWHGFGSVATDTSAHSVQGQRFASDGSRRGPQFQVNSYTPGYQDYASVTAGPAGDFVVVWQGDITATDTSGRSIRARRFTANGSPRGVEFQVNTSTAGSQLRPAAAAADGNFVIVWDSLVSSGTDTSFDSVQGQRFWALPIPVPASSRTAIFALAGALLILGVSLLSGRHR